MATERRKMVFHGRVQGVGFRYKARYYASSLGLTGWVKNEYDNTVSMEVQGETLMINRMLQMLNLGSYIEIDWVDSKSIEVVAERSFRVIY